MEWGIRDVVIFGFIGVSNDQSMPLGGIIGEGECQASTLKMRPTYARAL
jgi:hypothetical protein